MQRVIQSLDYHIPKLEQSGFKVIDYVQALDDGWITFTLLEGAEELSLRLFVNDTNVEMVCAHYRCQGQPPTDIVFATKDPQPIESLRIIREGTKTQVEAFHAQDLLHYVSLARQTKSVYDYYHALMNVRLALNGFPQSTQHRVEE